MLPDSPDPFYYLANFERALAWLDARCADLFDDAERGFAGDFARMPQASRALFVRMLMRKGPHFRLSRLAYGEIGCPRAAAAPLIAAGWLDDAPALDLDALAALVTKAELQALAARLGVALEPRATRAATLDALDAHYAAAPEPRDWHAWFPASPDTVLLFASAPLCERLRLMFFGNLHQDWSEFVLADLGVFRYESVPFDRASRAFQRREDIDAYLALRDCRDELECATRDHDFDAAAAVAVAATLQTLDALAPRTQGNAWLRARHDKLRHAAGLAAERAGEPELAWRAYLDCGHPESRYRRVRVLEQLNRREEAQALAQSIADAPENEEQAQRAARTLGRLARTRAKSKTSAEPGFAQLELTLPAAPGALRVEEAARIALATPQAPVFYVENTLINALFGLLCWPALFAPLPGAFFHPFQRGPADLHAADFVARRASQFETCLAELETHAYRDSILRRYAQKAGTQSPFVAWPALSDELLVLALDCFPAAHLRLWFERLLREPVANRSGLPDLVRFWPHERRYELIEVKGPGDRLQDNQRRWLAYCVQHRIPVSVLQVRWPNLPGEAEEASDSAAQAPRAP